MFWDSPFPSLPGALALEVSGRAVHPAGVQPRVKTGVLEVFGSLLLGFPRPSKILLVPGRVTMICLLVPSAPIPWTHCFHHFRSLSRLFLCSPHHAVHRAPHVLCSPFPDHTTLGGFCRHIFLRCLASLCCHPPLHPSCRSFLKAPQESHPCLLHFKT